MPQTHARDCVSWPSFISIQHSLWPSRAHVTTSIAGRYTTQDPEGAAHCASSPLALPTPWTSPWPRNLQLHATKAAEKEHQDMVLTTCWHRGSEGRVNALHLRSKHCSKPLKGLRGSKRDSSSNEVLPGREGVREKVRREGAASSSASRLWHSACTHAHALSASRLTACAESHKIP